MNKRDLRPNAPMRYMTKRNGRLGTCPVCGHQFNNDHHRPRCPACRVSLTYISNPKQTPWSPEPATAWLWTPWHGWQSWQSIAERQGIVL